MVVVGGVVVCFFVLNFIFYHYQTNRLSGKNISELIFFVSTVT